MPVLTIYQGTQNHKILFDNPTKLQDLLERAGFAQVQPCGGRGKCGKCAVMISGEISELTEAEKQSGIRLACQITVLGDAEVYLPEKRLQMQIELSGSADSKPLNPMPGPYGAAIDIGTTTLALKLCDMSAGEVIASSAMLNPQTTVAADVVGRIDAALQGNGERLQTQISKALETLMHQACAEASVRVEEVGSLSIAGNTTMLYLLTGKSPESLATAPFEADCLFDSEIRYMDARAYLPPCLHAFVGADISCAILASQMYDKGESSLLCDIGTNGEIALWHRGKLYIASTAAGPAFEGAGIECGCGCVPGAIDRVEVKGEGLICHTVNDVPAEGICGSGLLDAIASLLELEIIDETGAMEETRYPLRGNIFLSQADIRAVQLAKAAIAAGIECLIEAAGCRIEEISHLYLCGGFGSHLNLRSVGKIGLLPETLLDKVCVLGNASLSGAMQLLFDMEKRDVLRKIAAKSQHVNLGGSASFNNRYIDNMFFEE